MTIKHFGFFVLFVFLLFVCLFSSPADFDRDLVPASFGRSVTSMQPSLNQPTSGYSRFYSFILGVGGYFVSANWLNGWIYFAGSLVCLVLFNLARVAPPITLLPFLCLHPHSLTRLTASETRQLTSSLCPPTPPSRPSSSEQERESFACR